MQCQVCLRNVRRPAFDTPRIRICNACVTTLNRLESPALSAYQRAERQLREIIVADANADLMAPQDWRVKRGEETLRHFDIEFNQRLPEWLNRRAAGPYSDDATKQIRAHRRGLLRRTARTHNSYPADWEQRAHEVRIADQLKCAKCGASNVVLQAHHIVYVSNHGTHQKANLVTLCVQCHSETHGRELDAGAKQTAIPTPTPVPLPAISTSAMPCLPPRPEGVAPPSPIAEMPSERKTSLWLQIVLFPLWVIAGMAIPFLILIGLVELL